MSQFAQLFEAVKNESKESPQPTQKTKRAKPSSADKPDAVKAVRAQKPQDDILVTLNSKEQSLQKPDAAPLRKETPVPEKVKQIAKSRNAEYAQVLTYIRKNTHKEIKKVLIDDPQNRDLSDLVEELLSSWLNRTYND
ncbi:MAG: hypothetical protein ACR2L1_07055 [Pyrinomonadaceae bacterium]